MLKFRSSMSIPNFQLPKTKTPQAEEFRLPNGLRGLFIDIADCSSMSVEIYFQAGHYFSPPDKPELAHFLEHLVLGANVDHPTLVDLSRDFERFGAHFNAHTDRHRIWYEFDTPDFDWQRSLSLMLVAISQPLFLPAEFETEKQVVYQELTSQADDEDYVFFNEFNRKIGFWQTPIDQRIKKLENIDLKSIRDYHQKTHGVANMRLIVAGSLPADRRQWIKQQLQDLNLPAQKATWELGPKELLRPIGLLHKPNPKRRGVKYDLSFSNDQRRPSPLEADALATIVNLFTDGFGSRIYGPLRQRGLAYYINCGKTASRTSAEFDFGGDASPDKLEAIIDLVLTEIDRLLAGDLKAEEVEAINAKVFGDHLLASFTPPYWIGHYRRDWLDRGLIVPADYQARLKAANRQKVIEVARWIFSPKQWSLGLHGPASADLKQRLKDKFDNWQQTV